MTATAAARGEKLETHLCHLRPGNLRSVGHPGSRRLRVSLRWVRQLLACARAVVVPVGRQNPRLGLCPPVITWSPSWDRDVDRATAVLHPGHLGSGGPGEPVRVFLPEDCRTWRYSLYFRKNRHAGSTGQSTEKAAQESEGAYRAASSVSPKRPRSGSCPALTSSQPTSPMPKIAEHETGRQVARAIR